MVSELMPLTHSLLLYILPVESQIQEQLDAAKDSDLGEVVSFTCVPNHHVQPLRVSEFDKFGTEKS